MSSFGGRGSPPLVVGKRAQESRAPRSVTTALVRNRLRYPNDSIKWPPPKDTVEPRRRSRYDLALAASVGSGEHVFRETLKPGQWLDGLHSLDCANHCTALRDNVVGTSLDASTPGVLGVRKRRLRPIRSLSEGDVAEARHPHPLSRRLGIPYPVCSPILRHLPGLCPVPGCRSVSQCFCKMLAQVLDGFIAGIFKRKAPTATVARGALKAQRVTREPQWHRLRHRSQHRQQ
jgi:hypothetical protein